MSGANLYDTRGSGASDTRRSGLSQSSSVPTIGLRRMEALPAAARLTKTASMTSTRSQDKMPASPSNADDKKERDKEMAQQAASRSLWVVAHGCEMYINEFLALRKDDPTMQIKACPVPGITRALKQGAKLDWRNEEWDGATLLLKAVRTNSLGLVEYLMAVGADPLVMDNSGRSVFHWAAMEGSPPMMEFLIKNVAGFEPLVQATDSGGDTPIHLAAYYGHLPVVRFLTHSKVDPCIENEGGYTAQELAEVRRMWHVADYLSEKKQQKEDKEAEDFEMRNVVRPCNLTRANELLEIAKLNPKPKPKAAAKKK
jgi:ankyrin repeat protein